jgi:arylsulfatase A-like enzyme
MTDTTSKTFSLHGLAALALVLLCGCTDRNEARHATAEAKQPNILLIVVDDLAYTDLGVFGSEIETPNLDELARGGTIFNNFYAGPTCSPTRTMLLTGTDHHLAGMGSMYRETAPNQEGQPGYEGHLNLRVATIAELLQDVGYHTYMTGKWHLGYGEDTSPAARGFERSFASLAGGAGHLDMMPIVGPGKAPYREDRDMVDSLPPDFYSTRFLTQKMIEYIDNNRDDQQPFFAYLAYTAVHWPLQAPDESIARQAGNYDDGYDVLHSRRLSRLRELGLVPQNIEAYPRLDGELAWNELSAEQKQRESRLMEIYAAMVSDIDIYVGELVAYLKSIGEFDNTFILFMSDNGAEGHPMDQSIGAIGNWISQCCDNSLANMGRRDSFLWYGANWARAGVGPWRMFKAFTSEGGIRVPAFVHYPEAKDDDVNTNLVTVLDIVPTLLDLAGTDHPGSQYKGRTVFEPQGASMLPMLLGQTDSVHAANDVMGWELFGKTGIRQGDWKIIQEPDAEFWTTRNPLAEDYPWQLYNLADDPTELRDLATIYPDKLQEMISLWEKYARENGVIIPNKVMGY